MELVNLHTHKHSIIYTNAMQRRDKKQKKWNSIWNLNSFSRIRILLTAKRKKSKNFKFDWSRFGYLDFDIYLTNSISRCIKFKCEILRKWWFDFVFVRACVYVWVALHLLPNTFDFYHFTLKPSTLYTYFLFI